MRFTAALQWRGLSGQFDFVGLNIIMSDYFLPEYHGFQYRAWAPWPSSDESQMDWVFGVLTVEQWLEEFVGPHHSCWAWDRVDLCSQAQYIGVAFRDSPARTLFLLRWGVGK